MRIETFVCGETVDIALKAMRNPYSNWHLSTLRADEELSRKLTSLGGEHSKHLRLIPVHMEVSAPRYWWCQLDTYKFVERLSCSTMHTLLQRDLELADFEYDGSCEVEVNSLARAIETINGLRWQYEKEKDKALLLTAKKLLPESYVQTATIVLNYQQLLNIVRQRGTHKLEEWQLFCEAVSRMPKFKELTGWSNE